MSDVHKLLERGVGGATPPPDGFERMLRRHDRKRRNQRIEAGVVAIAIFVAAVWIVMSGGPDDRGPTPAGTGPAVTGPAVTDQAVWPDYPGQVGLVGLAPEGVPPSSPGSGELVVSFFYGHTPNGDPGRYHLDVYADGRLLRMKLGEEYAGGDTTATGWIEQRLSPEGVELIRSEVLATGLLIRDAHFLSMPLFGSIEVRDGDRIVHITWGDIGTEGGPLVTSTPEQRDALRALDTRLEDLSWLPASAWEDPTYRPYVPSRYSLCILTEPDTGLDRALGSLPRAVQEILRPLDRIHEVSDVGGLHGDGGESWCSTVTAEEARSIAGILDAAGVRGDGGSEFGLSYVTETRDTDLEITIDFWPSQPRDA